MRKEQFIVLGGLLGALVAGSFIYSLLVSNKALTPKPSQESQVGQGLQPTGGATPLPTPSPTPAPKDFVIKVPPQKAGLVVVVDYLETTKDGWLVIHKDGGGKAGEVLGEGIPQAMVGIHRKITFLLRDPLVKGQTYHAMFHVDDGDTVFEFPGADTPAKDKNDEVVSQIFTVR